MSPDGRSLPQPASSRSSRRRSSSSTTTSTSRPADCRLGSAVDWPATTAFARSRRRSARSSSCASESGSGGRVAASAGRSPTTSSRRSSPTRTSTSWSRARPTRSNPAPATGSNARSLATTRPMGDMIVVRDGGPGDSRRRDGDSPRRKRRTWWEIQHPEGSEGTWRDLPGLVWDSLKLVWGAGRREFLVMSGLQLIQALGIAAQLFIGKAVLDAVLAAGATDDFASVLPELAGLVAITVALDFARAIETEQTRVLSELVGRQALSRVIDVSTRVDLLAFESPDFYDRLQRARAQGMFRSMQTVNGLLGLVGSIVTAGGILIALFALQPLLLPLVMLGYIPLWFVASKNSRDLYRFMHGMTPNERQRHYLERVLMGRDPAKEVRSFGLAGFLRGRYDHLYDERIAELRSLARRRMGRSLLGSLAGAAVTAGTVAVLAWLFVTGRMGLAAAGTAVFGLYQLGGRLRGLYMSATSLYEATLFIRDYSSFLEREPARATTLRAAGGRERVVHVSGVEPACGRRRVGGDPSRRGDSPRRRERFGQDDPREDAGPPLPARVRADPVGRRRPRGRGCGRAARLDRCHLPGFRALSPARAREHRAREERVDRRHRRGSRGVAAGRCRPVPRRSARGLRDDARARVRRRLRPLDRAVAAGGTGAGVLPRRAVRDPRRADGGAGRTVGEPALRSHAGAARGPVRRAHLASVLQRPQCRPDLRAARRPRGGARRARRVDGGGRPVRGALHAPGARLSRHKIRTNAREIARYGAERSPGGRGLGMGGRPGVTEQWANGQAAFPALDTGRRVVITLPPESPITFSGGQRPDASQSLGQTRRCGDVGSSRSRLRGCVGERAPERHAFGRGRVGQLGQGRHHLLADGAAFRLRRGVHPGSEARPRLRDEGHGQGQRQEDRDHGGRRRHRRGQGGHGREGSDRPGLQDHRWQHLVRRRAPARAARRAEPRPEHLGAGGDRPDHGREPLHVPLGPAVDPGHAGGQGDPRQGHRQEDRRARAGLGVRPGQRGRRPRVPR